MGKAWDRHDSPKEFQAWCELWAREALRVLKPGGYLLAAGGTRTYHRLTSGIEDAGFEIRDCIAWMYGSGMPKGINISKAIDKAAGAEREVVGTKLGQPGYSLTDGLPGGFAMEGNVDGSLRNGAAECAVTASATPEAQQWQGWGTSLKPAHEPICVARKPLAEKTVAKNVLEHGTGALNIDATRIDSGGEKLGGGAERDEQSDKPDGWDRPWRNDPEAQAAHAKRIRANVEKAESLGRWPANVILDEEAGAALDEQTGQRRSAGAYAKGSRGGPNDFNGPASINIDGLTAAQYDDSGGASRFFYCAKTSKRERNEGMPEGVENIHPTVKPLALMRYLVRLVTPPGKIVLDPFCGSGSTGCAAVSEGMSFIGIDNDEESAKTSRARIAYWANPFVRASKNKGGKIAR